MMSPSHIAVTTEVARLPAVSLLERHSSPQRARAGIAPRKPISRSTPACGVRGRGGVIGFQTTRIIVGLTPKAGGRSRRADDSSRPPREGEHAGAALPRARGSAASATHPSRNWGRICS